MRVPPPGDASDAAIAQLRHRPAPQSREDRYHAAVHSDTVQRGARAAMAIADAERAALVERVEDVLRDQMRWGGEPDGYVVPSSAIRAALEVLP